MNLSTRDNNGMIGIGGTEFYKIFHEEIEKPRIFADINQLAPSDIELRIRAIFTAHNFDLDAVGFVQACMYQREQKLPFIKIGPKRLTEDVDLLVKAVAFGIVDCQEISTDLRFSLSRPESNLYVNGFPACCLRDINRMHDDDQDMDHLEFTRLHGAAVLDQIQPVIRDLKTYWGKEPLNKSVLKKSLFLPIKDQTISDILETVPGEIMRSSLRGQIERAAYVRHERLRLLRSPRLPSIDDEKAIFDI
ncbi:MULTISPECIES: hypothetical protein [Methylobacterium]|nr:MULTISPECIES: hypothetical protein [Methylobacterium]MCI9881829.1 hypothetical protein [Methylobacterium goesingense]